MDPRANPWSRAGPFKFTLENGAELLGAAFEHVQRYVYPDELRITQAQPLVDYILSTRAGPVLAARREELLEVTRSILARTGVIKVSKASGLFLAWG